MRCATSATVSPPINRDRKTQRSENSPDYASDLTAGLEITGEQQYPTNDGCHDEEGRHSDGPAPLARAPNQLATLDHRAMRSEAEAAPAFPGLSRSKHLIL